VTEHPLLADITRAADQAADRNAFLLETAGLINRHYPHYTWVGFYFLKDGKLHVGPYIGKPTPHVVIELDQGICGAAVSQAETVVVDDVNADPRYLACSLETRSEIVIPIRIKGEIIGELDIDSDRPAAFRETDREMLERVSELVGKILERQ
jgi:L-methionine (R)-S-oxide reductase